MTVDLIVLRSEAKFASSSNTYVVATGTVLDIINLCVHYCVEAFYHQHTWLG